MKNPVTEVRIAVELVLDVGSSWSPECTLRQVEEQATAAALRMLQRMLDGNPLKSDNTVLATTKVHSIVTKEGG